jgi:hypothetical protein
MGDGKKYHHGSSQTRCGNLTHEIFSIFKVYLTSCLAHVRGALVVFLFVVGLPNMMCEAIWQHYFLTSGVA